MGGIGVCESEVPCFALVDECCNQQINPASCLTILLNYWREIGFTEGQINSTIQSTMKMGDIQECDTSGTVMWWNVTNNDNKAFGNYSITT